MAPDETTPTPEEEIAEGQPVAEPAAEGEPAPEPTLEERLAAIEAERDQFKSDLEAKERVLSAKDKANARLQAERDQAQREAAQIREQSATEARRARLLAAQADPELADQLVREDLHRIDNPPPPKTPEQQSLEIELAAKQRVYNSQKTTLGVSADEEQQAFAVAKDWATADGRDIPSWDEGIAALSIIVARRSSAEAIAALEEKHRLEREEWEAQKAEGAGDRVRAAGGPEDRVPSNGAGKHYRSLEELDAARANRTISVAEYKKQKGALEPVLRRI